MAPPEEQSKETGNAEEAIKWLNKLIGKTLRIHLTDGRMMCGAFKCTDKDRNLIISNTHEYRETSSVRAVEAGATTETNNTASNVSTRYIGLITIGGGYITKIEVEEFDPAGIV